MAKPRSLESRARKVDAVNRIITELQREGVVKHRAGSGDGALWTVGGRSLRNFGSCSYMGLERHPALVAGAHDALEKYGTCFSISRIYLECPLYADLEQHLGRIMGRHVLVAQSTSAAHMAALPALVGDHDLVLLDQFAHASMHAASELISDVQIELVRHNRIDLLEQRLQEAERDFERVWYLCDGVYSMLGDFAPFTELADLLERYPALHLYVDDAHAMSWYGPHGRGAGLTHLGSSERVVVATSMAKAFGACGGILAFPTAELRERVRNCGGPLMFSGPLSPAVLGAAVASATLHLEDGFSAMQSELRERVAFARDALFSRGLTPATDDETPIFMLHYESATVAAKVVRAMLDRGFFCCPSTFPAVPINKPSIRFTVSRHNPFEDIEALIDGLAEVNAQLSTPEAKRHPALASSPSEL
jgi:7-keto-8-aminopelargonate synthetase-like enzyme